jgi:hypothetical protein
MVAGSAGDLLVMVLVVLVVQELPVDVVLVFVVVQVSGEDSGRKNHEATEAQLSGASRDGCECGGCGTGNLSHMILCGCGCCCWHKPARW